MWHSFPIWISERKLCKRFPGDFKVCGRSPNWPWSTLRAVCPSRACSCLLFNSQQPGRFSLSLFIFSSICHFIFPSLPLFVFSSLCLFVPSHVYCSPVTKRVASQTVLNELSRWVWWESWLILFDGNSACYSTGKTFLGWKLRNTKTGTGWVREA